MLLGPDRVRELLHEIMGYRDIHVPDSAFERDARWSQMEGFVGRLGEKAKGLGLSFGVKFTNTLIVENRRTFFPESEKEMYLSGPPASRAGPESGPGLPQGLRLALPHLVLGRHRPRQLRRFGGPGPDPGDGVQRSSAARRLCPGGPLLRAAPRAHEGTRRPDHSGVRDPGLSVSGPTASRISTASITTRGSDVLLR